MCLTMHLSSANNRYMKISELFQINIGYTFREPIDPFSSGDVGVVQAGDINEARLASIRRLDIDEQQLSQHILRADDILISARGRSIARTVSNDLLPAIAASSVIVLRPVSSAVKPRYVAQYLNSRSGQAALTRIMSGSHIKTLRKQELAELDIPVVNEELQSCFLRLGEVIEEQAELLGKKKALLEQIFNSAVIQVNKGAR